jgi:hypothetical protein
LDEVHRAASADYSAKRFHPWLLAPGSKGSGVVFFRGGPRELSGLRFVLRDYTTGVEREISMPFRPAQ